MGIRLFPGAFSTVLGLAGAGAVVVAPHQLWIGYGLLAAAALLLLWSIRINDRHFWTVWLEWCSHNVWWRFQPRPPLHPKPNEDSVAIPPPSFVRLVEFRKQKTSDGVGYHADVSFIRDVKNVSIVVEVSRAEVIGFGHDWAWRAFRKTTPLKGGERNNGDTDSVSLIELRRLSGPAPKTIGEMIKNQNALMPSLPHAKVAEQGRFRARLVITASGNDPYVEEAIYLWKNEELFSMPLSVPDHDDKASGEFKEESCVLWTTQ